MTKTDVKNEIKLIILALQRSEREENGADGRIRTSDHLIRSQVLYPAELRPHVVN